MRRRYGWGLVAVLVLAALVGLGYPANAVTLVTIRGHVTDKLGNPLSGVAVTDGNKTVYTDAGGNYSLPEDNLNDQVLSLSRTGLERIQALRVTAAQAATSTIATTMDYKLTLTTSPSSVNNATTPTLTVQVLAHAPANSCVSWTDPGQSVQAMTYMATDSSGRSTWRLTHSVALQPEGSYAHSAIAKDCGSQQAISTVAPAHFNIDTTPPRVSILGPAPNANTAFTSQRVIVGLGDTTGPNAEPGSGVNPSTLRVTLTDVAGNEPVRTPTIQQPGSALAKTAAMSLTAGKLYSVTATVSDYAGNTKTTTSQFRVLTSAQTTDPAAITAMIQETAATSKMAGGALETTDQYTWTNLDVDLGTFVIDIDSSLHAGDGTVNVAIPTDDVAITYTVQGVPGAVPAAVVEAELTTTADFSTNSTGHVQITVPAQANRPLSKLTAVVPKGADEGSVKLTYDGAASRTWFSLCADPWSEPKCSTDPIAKIGPSMFVSFDEEMAGAPWLLTTSGGASGAESAYLQDGIVPSDGHLHIALAASTLQSATTTNQLMLTAAKATSPSTAILASASLGLTSAEVDSGAWTDLGQAVSGTATTYPTPEEAVAAAQCPTCTATGVKEPGAPPAAGATGQAVQAGPPGGDPRPSSTPTPDTGEGPPPACQATNVCGIPTESQQTAATDTYTCGTMPNTGADCIVAYRDQNWVRALRGFSQKLSGFKSQFQFKTGTTQQWQNGWRMQPGPFSVNGTTTRTQNRATHDTWTWMHDCAWTATYSDGSQQDFDATGPGCHQSSRRRMEGWDTWRWEKHVRAICSGAPFSPCSYTVYERNYNYGYDGGQEVGWDTINWGITLARPSEIRGGQWGRATRYGRYADTHAHTLQNTVAVGNGASASVNYPESFGQTTFSSDLTNTRLSGVTNTIAFRPELPFAGWWYQYDHGTDWRWEYWSCESEIGWRWEYCWDNGS